MTRLRAKRFLSIFVSISLAVTTLVGFSTTGSAQTVSYYTQNFGTGTTMPNGWVASGGYLSVKSTASAPTGYPSTVSGSALNASATGTGNRSAIATITPNTLIPNWAQNYEDFSFDFFMNGGINTANIFTMGKGQTDSYNNFTNTFFALGNGDGVGARSTLRYYNYETSSWVSIPNCNATWLKIKVSSDFVNKKVSFTINKADGSLVGSYGPISFASTGSTGFDKVVMSAFRTNGGTISLNTWIDNFKVEEPCLYAQEFGTGTTMPNGWAASGGYLTVKSTASAPVGYPTSVGGSALNAVATGTGTRSAIATITPNTLIPNWTQNYEDFSFDFFMNGGINTANIFTMGNNQIDSYSNLSNTFFALGNGDGVGARSTLRYYNYETSSWVSIANCNATWLKVKVFADFVDKNVSFTINKPDGSLVGSYGPISFASTGATGFNKMVMSAFRTNGGTISLNTWLDNFTVTRRARQIEKLDRGFVTMTSPAGGNNLSWRWLITEPQNVGFNIYRDGAKINSTPITNKTNYHDTSGTTTSIYTLAKVLDGVEVEIANPITSTPLPLMNPGTSSSAQNPRDKLPGKLEIILNQPANGTTPAGDVYTYAPGDCSVGDLDGDGQYEIIVKWDPSNSRDNSQGGYTGNVILDGYKLNGTQLWRIDLGINIRAGGHYNPYIVYDLDGDGKAEIACKTADGSKDGKGVVIGNGSIDNRATSGYILTGNEYLTVFAGDTGKALTTVNYDPPRGDVGSWGDTYGNRVDRFLACVAYLDGEHPSLVMTRGYYTGVVATVTRGRTELAAYDFSDNTLTQKWKFKADKVVNDSYVDYVGQGNHNLSVADVDNDGYDEIIYGSMAVDNDGTGLYNTDLGHGDAMHVGKLIPSRPGLQFFGVLEEGLGGFNLRDAGTGEIIKMSTSTGDTGRGLSADIISQYEGDELIVSGLGVYANVNGTYEQISTTTPSINFATWWDGDLTRELFDAGKIDKYGVGRLFTAYEGVSTINGTKSTPTLQADLFGDWREEFILASPQGAAQAKLVIYTTSIPTDYKIYTLMHDPIYRLGIAWQNVGYNQPPHTSFLIGGTTAPTLPFHNVVAK